jgi:hypothetical protein
MPGNIHKTSANWGWIESTGSSPITILMTEVLPAGKSEDSYMFDFLGVRVQRERGK